MEDENDGLSLDLLPEVWGAKSLRVGQRRRRKRTPQ